MIVDKACRGKFFLSSSVFILKRKLNFLVFIFFTDNATVNIAFNAPVPITTIERVYWIVFGWATIEDSGHVKLVFRPDPGWVILMWIAG